MKKFLVLVLCMAMAISAFAACTASDNGTSSTDDSAATSVDSSEEAVSSEESSEEAVSSEESVADSTEDGGEATEYNNGYISFVYPAGCNETEISGIPTIVSEDNSFNITIASEPASDFYTSLTTESFATTLQPMLEAQGLTVSDVMVEQMVNDNSVNATVIAYFCTYNGVQMAQTLMVVTSGDTCQVVTLTETVDCGDLGLEIFNTIKVLK